MRFGKILILLSMAWAAGAAPRWMPSISSSGGDPKALLRSLQELQTQTLHGGLGDGEGQPPELQRMLKDMTRNAGAPSPDEEALSNELQASIGQSSIQSPVLQKLIGRLEKRQRPSEAAAPASDRIWGVWQDVQGRYLDMRAKVKPWLWAIPIILTVVSLSAFLVAQAGAARTLSDLGYGLSRKWLWVLSIAVAALAITTRTNPWPLVPRELLVPPILWMLASAFLLRQVDMNYPVWNAMVRGVVAPLLSMVIVLLINKFPLPGLG
jgi:hypothetical protein